MKCPNDGTVLQKVTVFEVDLDKCHNCDGLWLDHGELEDLQSAKTNDLEEIIEKDYGNPSYVGGSRGETFDCPRCGVRMRCYNYSYIKPVRIDTCPQCHGIWLDDGELDTIVNQKKRMDEKLSGSRLKAMLRALRDRLKLGNGG